MPVSVLNTDSNLSGKTLLTAEGPDTIDGLKTFDRGVLAPFAVAVGAAVVPNLDAEKMGGFTWAAWAAAQPRARAYAAAQAIANGVFAPVTFSVEDYDVGAMFTLAAPTRLTIPAGHGGLYQIHGVIHFDANATGVRVAAIRKNGVAANFDQGQIPASGANTVSVGVSSLLTLVAGDYIEMVAFQNSGGSLSTTGGANLTSLAIAKLY